MLFTFARATAEVVQRGPGQVAELPATSEAADAVVLMISPSATSGRQLATNQTIEIREVTNGTVLPLLSRI